MFGESSQTFEVMSGRVIVLCKELRLSISVRDSVLGCSDISTGPLHGPTVFLEHPLSPNCTWVAGYKLSPSSLKYTGSMLPCGYMKHCVLFLRVHLGTFFYLIAPAKEYKTLRNHVRSMPVNV